MKIGIGWDGMGWERGWMHGNEDGCMGMRMGLGRRKEDEYVHVPNYYSSCCFYHCEV